MVKLRLKRIGKKQTPFYRIVAADSRTNRNGQYIELVGTFDPLKDEVKLDKELVLKWLSNGAQPTDTVRVILSQSGVLTAYHEMKVTAKATSTTKKKTVKAETTSAKAKAKPTKKPVAQKPVAQKPVAQKPAAKKPAVKKAKPAVK